MAEIRLRWSVSTTGYRGRVEIVCGHDHETGQEAMECVRPVYDALRDRAEALTAQRAARGAAGQDDATETLPDEAGAWPLPGV